MEYKGDLEGFPTEIVKKMLERQVEQGHIKDVSVFENDILKGDKGFVWRKSPEGDEFWNDVILEKHFDLFFEKYPKKKELTFPRRMIVKDIITAKGSEDLVFGIFPDREVSYKVVGSRSVYKFAEELPEPVVKSKTELKAEELVAKANELLKLANELKASVR